MNSILYLPGLWYNIEMCRLSKKYIQSESDPPSKKKEFLTFRKWVPCLGSLGPHLAAGKEMMLCELKGLNHFPSLVASGLLLTIRK